MATITSLHTLFSTSSVVKQPKASAAQLCRSTFVGFKVSSLNSDVREKNRKRKSLTVVAAIGDVSSEGTTYLIAGAAAVALIGTAFPILFSRKDLYVNQLINFLATFKKQYLCALLGILFCVKTTRKL